MLLARWVTAPVRPHAIGSACGRQQLSSEAGKVWLWPEVRMGFDKPLLDLGSRISVEGGLLNFDLEAQKWRECLIALGLELD